MHSSGKIVNTTFTLIEIEDDRLFTLNVILCEKREERIGEYKSSQLYYQQFYFSNPFAKLSCNMASNLPNILDISE